jgi:hypothetical protein
MLYTFTKLKRKIVNTSYDLRDELRDDECPSAPVRPLALPAPEQVPSDEGALLLM